MKKNLPIYLTIFLAIGYLIIRITHFSQISTTITNDTDTYITIANQSILSSGFWLGIRPIVYPLVIKIFQYNWDVLAISQLIISTFAWLSFSYIMAQTIKTSALQILTFAFFLTFSLSTDIILWDRIIQTESFNISLFILIITLYIARNSLYSRIPTIFFLTVLAIWGFLRDTNAWALLFTACLMIMYFFTKKTAWKEYLKPVFLVFIFLLSNHTATVGNRWVVPFLNIMSMRILPEQSFTREFELRGMPVTPELLEQQGITFNETYMTHPDLENFRNWMFSNGKNSYMKFLLHHPSYFIQTPIENWRLLFGFLPDTQGTHNDNLDYAPQKFDEIISYPASEIFYPKEFGLFATLITLVIVGFLIAQKYDPINLLIMLLFITAYPMLILNYHGDASGISRHALSAILQLIVALWIFILIYLDKTVQSILRRYSPQTSLVQGNR